MSIISREHILRQQLINVKEGELILHLLTLSEEFGYVGCIDKFSFAVQKYVNDLLLKREWYREENRYIYIMNVCYVTELYLRGYYNKEHYMGYEEFLKLVEDGKSNQIIEAVHNTFLLHINRLKKIIAKTKKKIPKQSLFFKETRELLNELDRDLSICQRYPITSADLAKFYFGRWNGLCGTCLVKEKVGFINLEKEIYSLYNELSIISQFNVKYVDNLLRRYIQNTGVIISFNLFEKVINNYLFASMYSDEPEKLEISEAAAKLVINEVKMGTVTSDELISDFINRYNFEGYKAELLREYSKHLSEKIDSMRDSNYFGELFLITPPE